VKPPLSKKHRLDIAWWLFEHRNLTLSDSISDEELIETFHREAGQEWQVK